MPLYATSTRDLLIPVFSLDLLSSKMGEKVHGSKVRGSKFAVQSAGHCSLIGVKAMKSVPFTAKSTGLGCPRS